MSFELTRGLAAYDCPDHYAILGIALDASASEIRKRYLKIARSLHPDVRGQGADVAQASQLLSKLVNPAYETLSQDKDRDEYRLLIRLVSQRVSLEHDQPLQNEKAQELLKASDFKALYQDAVAELANKQYQALDHVQAIVEQLSELNLAYLLRQEAAPSPSTNRFVQSQSTQSQPAPSVQSPSVQSQPAPSPNAAPSQSSSLPVTPATAPVPPAVNKPQAETFVSQYVRRAEELIGKNCFPQAIQELREGLKLDPQNSQCQSLMGSIYLKQNKTTMAKVHFQQALKLNAADIIAIKGMEKITRLEKTMQGATAQGAQGAKQAPGRKGLFGLFGGKK
ncbi:MAG: DnaJ domain-containing protein [Thermosynechococcaceae cyanobacterium]